MVMAEVPVLAPEWPPTAGQLAALASAAHWRLEEVAFNLPRGRVTRTDLDAVAKSLEVLAGLLRRHEPEQSGTTIELEGGEAMNNSNGGGNPGELADTSREHTVNKDGSCDLEGCTIHTAQ
jgi:hypothetical protein